MRSLDEIKAPIDAELDEFERRFREITRSTVPLLDKITYYIVRRKGKQMRPMFVFLTAKMCGAFNEQSYTAASLLELLHTATLVHDDVVDDSNERRGFFSINALWKNKIAVLVGDFLFAQGLLVSLKTQQFKMLEISSRAIKAMSEGELLQIEKARRLDTDESVYYEVIRGKTASLIAAACASGAASTTDDAETVEKMWLFGEKIGMAFQIRDDLLDLGFGENTGKPVGVDIKEKKLTLPLIYALSKSDRPTKRRIMSLIKYESDKSESVVEVIDFVKKNGGVEYAMQKMQEFRTEALQMLDFFPETPSRETLKELVMFVTERKK
jgi:octaprenyl-diphosphate synthase